MKTELGKKIASILQEQKTELTSALISEIEFLEENDVLKDIFNIYKKVQKNPAIRGNTNALNSSLAYTLGITTAPPTAPFHLEKRRTYGRSGFPDIDMDFDYRYKPTILEYAASLFGKEYVASIGAVQTLQTKAAIRRVVKALDPDDSIVYNEKGEKIKDNPTENVLLQDAISVTLPKNMKKEDGSPMSVADAYEHFQEFRAFMNTYPEVFRFAKRLEGSISAYGTHAAGICISPVPLKYICPLHVTLNTADETGAKDQNAKKLSTQFVASEVEALGLIKFDVLGLSTKTAISEACRLIKQNHGISIDLERLPLKDDKVFDLLRSGKTDGCFQLEELGMKQTIQQIGVNSFNDLAVVIAMYRPGPLDFIPEYARRKRDPDSVQYLHPIVKKYTQKTYGIICFQEQAMMIFVELAGLTASEGYLFIKGSAKKKPELFQSMKDRFIRGATKIANQRIAEEVWRQMEPFQGYAFNKSLSFDQKVITSENEITIQDLYNRKVSGKPFPYAFSANGEKIRIVDVFDHGILPVWEIEFSNGSKHKSTLNHKFLTRQGVLPLHEIIERNLPIVRNARIENGHATRLDLPRLSKNFTKSPRVRRAQENVRRLQSEQEKLCLRRMRGETHSASIVNAQKTVPAMEKTEEPTLFDFQQQSIDDVLGRYQERSREVGSVQAKYVKVSFFSYPFRSQRTCQTIKINETDQCNLSRKNTRKQGVYSYKNICSARYTRTTLIQAEKMARRKPREVSAKMYSTSDEANEVAVGTRKVPRKYFKTRGVQAFPVNQECNVYLSIKKATNRFHEQKSQGSCRVRRTVSFQKSSGQFSPISKSTERHGGQPVSCESWLSGNQDVIRLLAVSSGSIQISTSCSVVESCFVLPRTRSNQNNWQEVQISAVRFVGLEQCYDLEVDSPDHLYCLASGIVNSNSHAFGYAYESWKTCYLKAHYFMEFMAARMSVEAERRKFDDVEQYEQDCIQNWGIKIRPPDINHSKLHYTIIGEREFLRPLAIKGIGAQAIEEIIKHQPYNLKDLVFSFASKAGPSINSKVVEAMYKAGLFGRKSSCDKVLEAFETIKQDRRKSRGQQSGDLFE